MTTHLHGAISGARRPTILLVEDTPSLALVYCEYLKREAVDVVAVDTGAAAMRALEANPPSAILLDLNLPDMDGMEILKRVGADRLPCMVIVVTAHGSVSAAVEAMRLGAVDFLVKPFTADRLLVTLRNALERRRLADIVETYETTFTRTSFAGFVGGSLSMQAVYRIIESAAPSKATVFITGESGTGKELCAQAIHQRSPRAGGPFVAINCAAIPKDLLESEMFGHVRGAFTGAQADREGAAARANGGTLFLDEVCEMEPLLQGKLLRFIQTGIYTPVGGNQEYASSIRFVCATNHDPLADVKTGRFREDLYYRLHVLPIHMPPLREREADMLLLARHFLAHYAKEEGKAFTGFATDAENLLISYGWPGNVRQLQNVLRNAVVMHDGEQLTASMLPPMPARDIETSVPVPPVRPVPPPVVNEAVRPLWQVEKQAIDQAVELCGGNIPKAAALLDVSASTIYRKLQRWEAGD